MGLAERRAVSDFKITSFPKLVAELEAAVGFPIPLDVKWETLETPGYVESFGEEATRLYFRPLVEALREVGADELGREALRSSLKRIVICNEGGHIDSSKFTFRDGVLVLDHRLVNTHAIAARTKAIAKLLNAGL